MGYVPEFPGARTQAATLDELGHNLREVIELLLEDGEPRLEAEGVAADKATRHVWRASAGARSLWG